MDDFARQEAVWAAQLNSGNHTTTYRYLGDGVWEYTYPDGTVEQSTSSPGQKILQDISSLFMITIIGKVPSLFKFIKGLFIGKAKELNNLVSIGEVVDDVIVFSGKFGDEVVEGIATFEVVGDKLYLNGLHLQGSSAGQIGRSNMWNMAKDLGKQFNVKEVVIQGGRRTTGKFKGTVPSPITIKVD